MWLAANWDGFGRYGRFGIVGAALVISVGGALSMRSLRPGFLLLGFFATGGLFALIGQAYQTGADPWSLFAIWAALTLPFALAARSDAVWSGWIIVALAAVTLWSHNAGNGLFAERLGAGIVLTAWALALGLCALLSPWSPLKPLSGSMSWAWRIGLWLTVSQISLLASSAILVRTDSMIYFGGLALLSGIAILILTQRPFDIVAGAVTGLAIDIALIVGLTRAIFSSRSDGIASALILGLMSAAIVAGTATILLKRFRGESEAASGDGGTPWPVVVMTAFGASVAAIPILLFYIFFIAMISGDRFLDRGPIIYTFGAVTLALSVFMLRKASLGRFGEIFALIFAVVGMAQVGFALIRDLQPGLAVALLAVGCGALAALLPQRWIVMMLGAAAGACAGLALTLSILGHSGLTVLGSLVGAGSRNALGHAPALQIAETVMILAVAAVFVLRGRAGDRLTSFLTGWIAAAVLLQAGRSGQTFLFGAFTGAQNREVTLIGTIPLGLRIAPLLLAMAGIAWLSRKKPEFRTPLLLGTAIATLLMTTLQPSFGLVAFVAAVMLAEDRRRLALLAGLAALWMIGAWYYAVTLPLTHKGMILMGIGAALGGLAVVTRTPSAANASAGSRQDGSPALAAGLIALGGVAIAGLAGWSIWDKERILRDGRMVMLRIVPVDPRSLMQGDYMTLAFELPERRADASARQPGGPQPVAVGTVGPDNVVALSRIVLKRPASVAPDDIVIALGVKNGNYVVGSDAWFFKEGDASRFTGARYGIFRVTSDGTALLAGLADVNKRQIR
jgi:uncharacterized membrane-anchored protein/uncharacterized membrane protein